MSKALVITIIIVIGALLAIVWWAPNLWNATAPMMSDAPPADQREITGEVWVQENEFGPDVALDENAASLNVEVWALIDAVDPYGVTVQGIKVGDTIAVESVSGIAWFSDQSVSRTVLSTIYSASSQLIPAGPIQRTMQTIKNQIEPEDSSNDANRDKARDGYGRRMNGAYAEKEGGIVICMPSAYGPMYANDNNHFESGAVEHGRFGTYMNEETDMRGKCFFPTRNDRITDQNIVLSSVMENTVDQDGVLHILAFDSRYEDNAGSYQVKFRIIRKLREL